MSAVCENSSTDWMRNAHRQSPCEVAGYLYSPCTGSNFTVLSLKGTSNSYVPGLGDTSASRCSCSWAVYNLLSACRACQEQDGISHIRTWPDWTGICINTGSQDILTPDTWFPAEYGIPTGTSVPAWAQFYPANWTNQRFDITKASQIASSNIPDSTSPSKSEAPKPSTKNVPIGAIVGGVIGGLALLTGIAFLVWYARFRTRTSRAMPMIVPYSNGGMGGRPVQPVSMVGSYTGTTMNGSSHRQTPSDEFGGRLGMVIQSTTNGRVVIPAQGPHAGDTHNRNTSADTSQLTAAHNRTMSSETTFSNHLVPEAIITPWIPPGQTTFEPFQAPGSAPTSPGMTPARRKAEEAASNAAAADSRRFNPPTYETAVAYGGAVHGRSVSNDSTPDLSTAGAIASHSAPSTSQISIRGVPVSESYGGSQPSPAIASSNAFPPTPTINTHSRGPGRRTYSDVSLRLANSDYPMDRKG